MKSIDIANALIRDYGDQFIFTNLKLNKIVYYTQVESLRASNKPLFSDPIEAWQYGPVEPAVYHTFKKYGSSPILAPTASPQLDEYEASILTKVIQKYADLTAFDLVNLTHKPGGAWSKACQLGYGTVITNDMIRETLGSENLIKSDTLAYNIQQVESRWPNALRMLEDS